MHAKIGFHIHYGVTSTNDNLFTTSTFLTTAITFNLVLNSENGYFSAMATLVFRKVAVSLTVG